MGRKPLSKLQKKHNQREDLHRRKQRALEAYQAEKKKPEKERRSIRTLATIFGVPASSLGHLSRGRRSQKDYARDKELLLEPEDVVLTQHLLLQANRGFPLTPKMIAEKANAILKARLGDAHKGLGKRWVTRFMSRHPQLQEYRSTGLERARANGFTKAAVKLFQQAWQEVYDEHSPEPPYMFAVDETGLMMGVAPSQIVVGERGRRNLHLRENGNRQLVTSMVTICADGSRLKETIIFKGKNCFSRWGDVNPGGYSYTSSAKGYTNNELGVEYIKDFHEQTKEKADKVRILFVDGHASHCTLAFLDFAAEHNIIIISYPPHTTHKLQGLDVACFGPLKIFWAQERDKWERERGEPVRKEDFLRVYHLAATRAFTEGNIRSAFRATGVWPINHEIFSDGDFAPAQETSTHGSFPCNMSTPVKLVMATFWTSPVPPTTSSQPPSPSPQNPVTTTPPRTPTLSARQAPSSAQQLATLITPSKRKGARQALLRHTRDIFATTTSPLKSSLPKPVLERIAADKRPDFSILDEEHDADQSPEADKEEIQRLRKALKESQSHINDIEAINVGAQAQLVVQGLFNDGLMKKLYHKENPETASDVVLSKATDNRIWTSTGRRDALRRKEAEKAAAETAAAAGKAEKQVQAEKKRKYDEWKATGVAQRKKIRLDYQAECQRCEEEGLSPPPKLGRLSVPKTPPHLKYTKRPRKKKASEPQPDIVDEDDEEIVENGSNGEIESEDEE